MKTVNFTGTMKNAHGVKLTKLKLKDGSPVTFKSLDYAGDYKQYESKDEMIAAEGFPSDEDIVAWRNTLVKNAARAKAANNALDAANVQKPDLENDEQLRLKSMLKVLLADGKKTEAEARAIASQVLGIEWADEDEDA